MVDLRPTIRAIAADARGEVRGEVIASRFYTTMAEVVAASCVRMRAQLRLDTVALSGGCFQSALLTERARARSKDEASRCWCTG